MKVVHDQIADRVAKKKTMNKANSEKTVPSKNEKNKEDGWMLKSTKAQISNGLRKTVVFDKKYDHTSPPKVQLDEYYPFSVNVRHHPLRSILESTGALYINEKRTGFSNHKGWRNIALCVPFQHWDESVVRGDDSK